MTGIVNNKHKRVFVAMSGGVDSSVAALLLQQQGYDVTGVYMKNWSDPLADECPWEQDAADFLRVCKTIGIPHQIATFEDAYRAKVVEYLIKGYRAGLTPNPDMLCNREIKFKVFLKYALAHGANYIATGHYVRRSTRQNIVSLHAARDHTKDQSYFLALLTQAQAQRSLFPLGTLLKSEVRRIAKKNHLHVHDKKDSQGICFIGKVKFKDFIRQFIPAKPGNIVMTNGTVIGKHEGLSIYTIGQRHGIGIGGGIPYYVVEKNIKKNELVVTPASDNKPLFQTRLVFKNSSWVEKIPNVPLVCQVRIRYRQPLQKAKLRKKGNFYRLDFVQKQRAVSPGQIAALYSRGRLLGGGIIVK
ncbi:MAG: tRNA 2-thiouridine(34) synthase MnmA [Candidatus Kerfeldbacteria bacterium]|nr:tRNA 2-thiouridine(34) synthase MnmA [Candidatus Kerfeldbacteria bacterium]